MFYENEGGNVREKQMERGENGMLYNSLNPKATPYADKKEEVLIVRLYFCFVVVLISGLPTTDAPSKLTVQEQPTLFLRRQNIFIINFQTYTAALIDSDLLKILCFFFSFHNFFIR